MTGSAGLYRVGTGSGSGRPAEMRPDLGGRQVDGAWRLRVLRARVSADG